MVFRVDVWVIYPRDSETFLTQAVISFFRDQIILLEDFILWEEFIILMTLIPKHTSPLPDLKFLQNTGLVLIFAPCSLSLTALTYWYQLSLLCLKL